MSAEPLHRPGWRRAVLPALGAALALLPGVAPPSDGTPLPESPPETVRLSPPEPMSLLFGWPRQMAGDQPLWRRTPTVLDLDRNADWEIALVTTEGRLYVYQHDGANYPGFPMPPYAGNRGRSWERAAHPAVPAVADLNADGLAELIFTTDIGYLHSIGEDRFEVQGFPVDFGRGRLATLAAAADLNGDGDIEVLFTGRPASPDSVEAPALLHVYSWVGEPFEGFPLQYPLGSESSPAAGDLDRDGQVEIVVGASRSYDRPGRVWAWRRNGAVLDGFPVGNFETVSSSPTLADLDSDGRLEIVVFATPMDRGQPGIYAWDWTGRLLPRYPLRMESGHPEGEPATADLSGSRAPEIVFGTFNPTGTARVYAWHGDGTLLEGFPVNTDAPAVVGSVILADVSGDGENDVIAALAPHPGRAGRIAAWNAYGEMVPGFPIDLADYGGGAFAGPPAVWDVNRDGHLDLAAVTTDRRVFVWSTPGRMTLDWWPAYRAGGARTGVRPADNPRAVPTDPAPTPKLLSLVAFPNPTNGDLFVRLQGFRPTASALELCDLSGRVIAGWTAPAGADLRRLDLAAPRLPAGIYLLRWRTPDGTALSPVAYQP